MSETDDAPDPAYDEAVKAAREAYRDALGGKTAEELAIFALEALHAYAHASGCPAGSPVVAWFRSQHDKATAAHTEIMRAFFAARRATPSS